LKITEIRAIGKDELERKLEEAQLELFNLQVRAATRQLASNREIPKVRKKIAQMNTVLHEYELGIGK
jgi:ribosomal protein L29